MARPWLARAFRPARRPFGRLPASHRHVHSSPSHPRGQAAETLAQVRGGDPAANNARTEMVRSALRGRRDFGRNPHTRLLDLLSLAVPTRPRHLDGLRVGGGIRLLPSIPDRKSTRLNSSHRCISYAV